MSNKTISFLSIILLVLFLQVLLTACNEKEHYDIKPLDKSIATGDVIMFGSYEQDENLKNGAEPIEWLVLSKTGSEALLLSKMVLDYKPYNQSANPREQWGVRTLPGWLDSVFYNDAFNPEEKELIIVQEVSQDESSSKVFLLTAREVEQYCSYSNKKCTASDYAVSHGAKRKDSSWWTSTKMTPVGITQLKYYEVCSFSEGEFWHAVESTHNAGVRPAIRIYIPD